MNSLKRALRELAAGVEHAFDQLTFSFRKLVGFNSKLHIMAYRTYGTRNDLYVKGRVLVDKQIRKSSGKDSKLSNLFSMYKRFESDEIPHARLRVTFEGKEHFVKSDHEGYFVIHLCAEKPMEWKDMWYLIDLELLDAPVPFTRPIKAVCQVLVPPADAEYGIISDIDDTIVKTSATSLLGMSRNTFLHNAHTRLPFAGVAEFYKALQLGRNGKRNNPFFYVSSSPWNLYDFLIEFMDLNRIPAGPLLLRDFGFEKEMPETSGHMGHKFSEIAQIMQRYPSLNFVLIGDSGQEDPKIYREVVRKFPGRVLAVYIRDVQLADREKIAIEISREVFADKVEMVIVDNTVEAATHASKIGLILAETIPDIVEEKNLDKGEKPGKASST